MPSLRCSTLALTGILTLNITAVDAARRKLFHRESRNSGALHVADSHSSQDMEPRPVQGSNAWWSCGEFKGVQTEACPDRTHCCCVEGYFYDAGVHRCSKVSTTTTTTAATTTVATAAPTATTCSLAVPGAVDRQRASWQFWLYARCKCPRDSVIAGDGISTQTLCKGRVADARPPPLKPRRRIPSRHQSQRHMW